jgi:dTDP-4-dehydrorhamnose reductase
MRCFILGASGLLGSQLAAQCDQRRFPWLGTTCSQIVPFHVPLDLRDSENLQELLEDYQPEVTFLAADAPTKSVKFLAQKLRSQQSRLVFFSRDEVFGECQNACREDEPRVGTSKLALAKREQEDLIRELLPDQHLIVRSSWLFGPQMNQNRMLSQWLDQWERGETVNVSQDRYGQPTFAPDLAKNVLDLVKNCFHGTIHLVGPERHTEFSFARLACHLLGYDMDLVEAKPTSELPSQERPLSPWLDRFLMRNTVGSKAIRPTADALRQLRQAVSQPMLRAA